MCGISVILAESPITSHAIQGMTQVIQHRGPDSQGVACLSNRLIHSCSLNSANQLPSSKVFLGHTRLSIIDTTSAGFQPKVSHDGQYAIAYNGEIYNYLEVKRELEAEGYQFHTSTDTEVLLQAYIAWGDKCVSRFNGIWAFAILDIQNNILVVSRDRLGVKPLYMHLGSSKLLFASEIKSIITALPSRPRPNQGAISDYLNFSLVDHTRATFFDSIEAFAPGHITSYCLDRRTVLSSREYWSVYDQVGCTSYTDYQEACEYLIDLFKDSVRLRMRSDVPIGASLSGGVDSSAVVCMMSELLGGNGNKIHTFTCVPENRSISEEHWASIASAWIGSSQHIVAPPQQYDYHQAFANLLAIQDQPFTTSSIYAQQAVMDKASREGIKVMLDGQGADEAFAGYRKYIFVRAFELLRQHAPLQLIRHVFYTLLLGDTSIYSLTSATRYVPSFLKSIRSETTPCLIPGLLDTTLSNTIRTRDLSAIQIGDLTSTSLPSLLRYNDHNSMSCGIEARNPFLDYRLIELGLSIPSSFKLSNGRTKAILRSAFKGLVPNQILQRRNKMGFTFSQDSLMSSHLRPYISAALSPQSNASEYLSASALSSMQHIWAGGQPANQNTYNLIFRAYILDLWLNSF